MQFNLTHSLRTHLENNTGIQAVWVFDGVKLPTTRPLITVEQMSTTNEVVSKERTAQTVYRYQVGLFATTIRERSLKQDEVRRAIMGGNIEILDASSPGNSLGFFNAEVTAETPITPEDISDKSSYHRVYFDVRVASTN